MKGTGMRNQVIFYGAGQYAVKMLQPNPGRRGPVSPPPIEWGICFVDSDKNKHGSSHLGLPIMSADTALGRFPNANIYLTVGSMKAKYDICCYLQDLGVASDRILNRVVRRISCPYLEHFIVCGYHEGAFGGRAGVDCGSHSLKSCCSDYGKNNVDSILVGDSLPQAFEAFIRLRDGIIQRLNAGEPTSCDGCPELQHMYAPIQRYFTHVIYNELGRCNFRCIYCNYEDRLGRDISSDVDVRQLLGLVQQYGFDNDNGVIELCNGEITIHPHKKAIYDVVKDNNVMFLTNGFVYDEEIQRRMLDGKGVLNISLDSGTKSTFFKVKGVDAFERVVQNLKRYNRNRKGILNLKYIFVPGVNDNMVDVNGFLNICTLLSVTSAHISFDLRQPEDAFNNERTVSVFKHVVAELKRQSIPFEVYLKDVFSLIGLSST
jgi:pyruvate-formate lyase-activating enzyme